MSEGKVHPDGHQVGHQEGGTAPGAGNQQADGSPETLAPAPILTTVQGAAGVDTESAATMGVPKIHIST